jgi:hypothetical protein
MEYKQKNRIERFYEKYPNWKPYEEKQIGIGTMTKEDVQRIKLSKLEK